ncbi:uncharacterized protein BDV17DRAFT_106613 [Aspergillus undulatus]|uniref:uncharacterized protein n=1 Tax=Aspergillus undulatus TaxID=1810928 RepID=UPI003CCCF7ED
MALHTHKAPYTALLQALILHLPTSGPLLRRLQYEARHPSPTARVLTTFAEEEDPNANANTSSEPQPWLAAYVDVYCGLATQAWIFSSTESKVTSTSTSTSTPTSIISKREREITKTQLFSLFTLIRTDLIPPYLDFLASQPPPPPTEKEQQGVKKLPAHPPSSILVGTVHEALIDLLVELTKETDTDTETKAGNRLRIHRGPDLLNAKYCFPSSAFESGSQSDADNPETRLRIHRGQDVLYKKYSFPSSAFSGDEKATTTTQTVGNEKANEYIYTFTSSLGAFGIQRHHLDLVKSRTNIPRSSGTLMAMGGVALYHRPSLPSPIPIPDKEKENEMPIAWAFLGFDGSLCTLHVEPEHRGRGLGGLVGREVMKSGGEVFGPTYFLDGTSQGRNGEGEREGGQEWFFADVAVENMASRRVMEKMGGEARWNVAWLVIEVDI